MAKLHWYPHNLPEGPLQPFACAMDVQYIISEDPVVNYRNYYKHGKTKLHKWTKREVPSWVNE